MSTRREIIKAIRLTLVLWGLTAIIYPLFILIVGQTLFPVPANGSLLQSFTNEKVIMGSALIGQSFTSERYFQGRPSTINYSQGKDAQKTGLSGASNFAPSNPQLLKRIQADANKLFEAGIRQPTADMFYASGSGLDPHITPQAARAQLDRVANARGLTREEVARKIQRFTQGRFLGIFGEPGVNILRLNNALDVDELGRKQR